MIDEEDFINTLKDCWADRKYESNTCTLRVIRDFNNLIVYEVALLEHASVFLSDYMAKSEFREYLFSAGYERIK